jgi:acetyl esterase/lipase
LLGVSAQEHRTSEARLQRFLQKFLAADANRDGILTELEAREFRRLASVADSSPTDMSKANVPPTQSDVSYGSHERNRLDFWQAASDIPTPVLIFFHGGSFKAGDKSSVLTRPIFRECLAAGISVISANYRFSSDAPFPAPMHDGARVVQYVRYKARDWNLDPERIAVSGSSAGATLAMWIALHDDLANSVKNDPVSHLSTRVACACLHSGTAGLEPEYFQQQTGVMKLGPALWQLFGTHSQAEFESTENRHLLREASPVLHATSDDPPLFLTYAGRPADVPFTAEEPQKNWIHHVSLGVPLKNKYDSLGLECELHHQGNPPEPDAEIAFLKKHLFGLSKPNP